MGENYKEKKINKWLHRGMKRRVVCTCHCKFSGPGFEMLSKCVLNCIRGRDRLY